MDAIVVPGQSEQLGAKVPLSLVKAPQKRRTPQPLDPEAYLNKLCTTLDKESQRDAYIRADRWNRNYFYFLGGLANAQGYSAKGIWRHLPSLRGLHTSNNFAEKIMTLMSVLVRSNPKYKVTPSAGAGETPQKELQNIQNEIDATDQKRSGSVIAQRITDFDSREKCQATTRLSQWFYRLLFGTSFAYINYDKDAGRAKANVPTLTPQTFDQPGMNYCGGCGMTFPGDQGTPCRCGAGPDKIEHFPGQSFQDNVMGDDVEQIGVGDTRLWIPSPWEIGLPPNARLSEDNGKLNWDYVVWSQMNRKKRIGYVFDATDEFDDDLEVPRMVMLQERLEREWVGPQYSLAKDFAVLRRYWCRPWMYYDGRFHEDTTLADGTEMSQGTRYIDACPDGMYIARTGHIIRDVQKADIDNNWSMSHYTYNPLSPWGKGLEDAADLQVIINALYQIAVEHGKRDAAGVTIFNQNSGLSTQAFMGGNVIPADIEPSQDIRLAATQLTGNTLAESLFTTLEIARNDQTAVSGASSVLAGTNETLPETATATKLLVQRATSILTPALMMDVEQGRRIWTQNLKLRQKYQNVETFMPFTDDNEHEEGRAFSSADIPTDFVMSVVDGSWMPTDSLDVQADLEQSLTLGQIPFGIWNPQCPPEVKQAALSVLTTLPRSLNKDQIDEANAHKRMMALKKGAQTIKSMGLPDEAMAQAIEHVLEMPSAKIRPQIDKLPIHVSVAQAYCKGILDDPENDVDYVLVAIIEGYVEKCKEGMTEQATEASSMEVASQVPQALAQQAMAEQDPANQPEPPEQAPPVDPNAVMEQGHEQQMAGQEAQQADLQRQHELKMAKHQQGEDNKSRAHEKVMSTHEKAMAAQKVKLERAKPRKTAAKK